MSMREKIKYLPKVIVPLLLVLLIALGTLSLGFGLTAKAATPPSLTVELGTSYRYSVAKSNPDSIKYGTGTSATSQMDISKSGNTITIQETGTNKLYELGYVPIVTSLDVPAETTLYVTLTFALSGNKNGTGSAQETIELFDFGSSDKSSSLTFKTTSDSSSSYTKASDRNTGSGMAANYTVTVAYKNTATTTQTIKHYFGFFAGVHYGSSKNHKLVATCTIASGTVTTGSSVAAQISFNQSDARTTVVGRSDLKTATYPKDNFFPDADYTSLTTDQRKSIASISNSTCNTDGTWRANRLSVKQLTGTKLQIFSNATPLNTGLGRVAYTPFTVPITVPAYTKRIYYLTFEITYNRNSGGSGAGFFAELIEGSAPNAFNTNNSTDMTGTTKLRVYSSSGDAHSGTVELRVELNNTTNTEKTYEQSYVFFAGHRSVGLYTPKPEFQLELKNVGYNQYEDTYDVTKYERNCKITVASSVPGFTQLTATVTPDVGYSLPSAVTVTVDGKTLAPSKYTYNKGIAKITIPMDYVKGAICISVLCEMTPAEPPVIEKLKTDITITYGQMPSTGLTCSGGAYHDLSTEWFECDKNGNNGTLVTDENGKPTYIKMPTAGVHYYYCEVIGTRQDNGLSARTKSAIMKVTVNKATPDEGNNYNLSASKVDLAVNETLSESILTGGEMRISTDILGRLVVPGTFSWVDGSTKLEKPQSGSGTYYEVRFTPDDTDNYNTVILKQKVWVRITCTHGNKWGAWQEDGTRTCTACGRTENGTVSVSVTWGAMEFTYYDGDWNPETHEFGYGYWAPDAEGGNSITVENVGTAPATVEFTYHQNDTAVNASFDDGTTSVTSPLALPMGTKKTVWLTLSGKPSSSMRSQSIGWITITIGRRQTS